MLKIEKNVAEFWENSFQSKRLIPRGCLIVEAALPRAIHDRGLRVYGHICIQLGREQYQYVRNKEAAGLQ